MEKRIVWDEVSFIASPLYFGRTYGRIELGAVSTMMLLLEGRPFVAAKGVSKIMDSIHPTNGLFILGSTIGCAAYIEVTSMQRMVRDNDHGGLARRSII